MDYGKYYPKIEHRRSFCKKYLESRGFEASEENVDNLVHDCDIMAISSHYFWATWALMQNGISDIDFDYLGYAVQRLDEMCKLDESIGLNAFQS